MSLDVSEIRTRGEAFEARCRNLWFEVGAGLEPRPTFDDLYDRHPFLADPDTLAVVERALAGAEGEEQGRMRCLLEWLADRRVDRALAPLHDEYLAWEAGTTVMVTGREIPLRQLSREIMSTGDRERRQELAALRHDVLEEATSLWLDLVEREREAVRDLGYGDYREARDRLSRQDHTGVLQQGRVLMEETEEVYRAGLERELGSLGVAPGEAEVTDAWALQSLDDWSRAFRPETVRRMLEKDLRALGLDPDARGRLSLDLKDRPLKRPVSFCSAPRVPERIVGVVGCRGEAWDARDVLGLTGEGLGRAFVDPRHPFEWRFLGDPAVGKAHDDLFRGLLGSPEWTGRLEDMAGPELERCVQRARWLELMEFRRDVALLDFQLRIWEAPEPRETAYSYPETIQEAIGFRPAPSAFVDGLEEGLGAAARLRGRMLGAMIRETLDQRFGSDWFRRPTAAPLLRDLMARGWRTASSLARELGAEGVTRDALARRFREAA